MKPFKCFVFVILEQENLYFDLTATVGCTAIIDKWGLALPDF